MKPQQPTSSLAAARMRRHRQRRQAGLRCLRIELRKSEIEVLVRWGYLKNETRNDERAVIEALYAHLESTLV
jgi:hypothetical protein